MAARHLSAEELVAAAEEAASSSDDGAELPDADRLAVQVLLLPTVMIMMKNYCRLRR